VGFSGAGGGTRREQHERILRQERPEQHQARVGFSDWLGSRALNQGKPIPSDHCGLIIDTAFEVLLVADMNHQYFASGESGVRTSLTDG
jgi:hypothetical protein